MRFDVVIVSHDSSQQLARAIRELPAAANVIVVDNASADRSAEIAREFNATVIESDVNAGFAAAANQGAAQGSGEAILFLNPDAWIAPTQLDRLIGALERDDSLGIVSPQVRYPDGVEQRTHWPFPSATGAWRDAIGLHRRPSAEGAPGAGFVIGACFLVRRRAFQELGGFDTRYWLYAEETDFCWRALEAGWGVEVATDTEATHVGGASGGSEPALVFEHFERGGERFVLDRASKRSLVSYRLANLAGAALRAIAPGPRERRELHRQRFLRVGSQLLRAPTAVPLDSPATQTPARSLVVCSLEDWDDVWRRNQFLVRELLDADPNLRVLFVEPPFDWLHQLQHRRGSARRHGVRPVTSDGRVLAFQPAKVAPRSLGSFSDASIDRQVRRAAAKLGFTEPTLWINDPARASLVASTGWPSVYDITDDWLEAERPTRVTRRTTANERELLARADAVVVCSPGLATSRRHVRPDLVVIPNAVDAEHFNAPRARPDDLPVGPTGVYVGTLHEDRLDVELVRRVATALPHLTIVLVGPNALTPAANERLRAVSNVLLLGSRRYADVPAYLQHADVVLVPHRVTPFTESLDPIKAYESLATGRPTVATPIAGFRGVGAAVRVVEPDRFVAEIEAALADGSASAPTSTASWTDRARAFATVLATARTKRSAEQSQRTLKVVFVDHCAQLSGGELALVRLLPALENAETHVILGEHGPLEARLEGIGASFEVIELHERVRDTRRGDVRLGRIGLRTLSGAVGDIVALRKRLRELKPDLVHTNSLKAAVYGGIAARLERIPVVWHVRDRIARDYLPIGSVHALHLLAARVPAALIFNSKSTRATVPQVRRGNIIHSPVIHDGFDAASSSRDREPRATVRIAMVGRLAPWKGQHIFLEAFAKASTTSAAHALIAGAAMFGDDDYARELRVLTDRLGISDRVTFTGFVDDVPTLLRDVDILVHASVIPEPFGQVIVEGMAARLPVIASAAGGPLEIITDEVDGILVPPGDIDALAAQLVRLAADPKLRQRLGDAARARAREFAPEKVALQVRQVWNAVAKPQTGTPA